MGDRGGHKEDVTLVTLSSNIREAILRNDHCIKYTKDVKQAAKAVLSEIAKPSQRRLTFSGGLSPVCVLSVTRIFA
jgi:hypothetical protein